MSYQITVSGQYHKRVENMGGGTDLENYSEIFTLDDLDSALSIIQNKLINARLREKDPRSQGFRTCAIIDIKDDGKKSPGRPKTIDTMNLEELTHFCIKNSLPVQLEGAGNIIEARQRVRDAEENKKIYEKAQLKKLEEKAKDNDLLKINGLGELD